MMRKEVRNGDRGAIILGLLQNKIIGGIDRIWWIISSSCRAGDLLIAVIVRQKYRHSCSCRCSDSKINGRNEDDVLFQTLRCLVRSKANLLIEQLTQLKRLCTQKQIQMDVKLVAGEKPKVLVQQAAVFGASTLIVNTFDRFPWSHRNMFNYIVENAPRECSVVLVKKGAFTYFKDKNGRDMGYATERANVSSVNEDHEEAQTESDPHSHCHPTIAITSKNEDDLKQQGSFLSESSVPCNESCDKGNQYEQKHQDLSSQTFSPYIVNEARVPAPCEESESNEKHDEQKEEDSFSEISSQDKESNDVRNRGYCLPSEVPLDSDENQAKEKEDDQDLQDCLSSTEVIDVFFDADEDEEYYQCSELVQDSDEQPQTSSDSNVFGDHFHVRDTDKIDAQVIGEVTAETGDEVTAESGDDGVKNWSKKNQGSSPRGVLDRLPSSIDSDSCSPGSRSSSDDGIKTTPPHFSNENARTASTLRSFVRRLRSKSKWKFPAFSPPTVSMPSSSKKDFSDSSKRTNSWDHRELADDSSNCTATWNMEEDLRNFYSKPSEKLFSLKQLEMATCNFSPDNIIGKGGYAEVYKGFLPDGQTVAIKKLNRSETEEQREHDFLTEIGIIAHINHPNAARLIGYGTEGGQHIILQFSPHGSLASVLHGPNPEILEWDIRYRIAIGVARGLNYLHEGCVRRIIHRDIKAANILLTEDFEPQIADFGLAKWLPQDTERLSLTPVEGTFGYLAPEYFMHGFVNAKTDVFAFGVLLLELITGRHPIDSSQQSLVMWAKPLIENRRFRDLADPCLGDSYDFNQMSNLALIAGLCVQQSPDLRPSMAQVLRLLSESSEAEKLSPQPDVLSDTDEYTSANYINDLSRHIEIALQD